MHITRGGHVQSLAGGVYCFPIECINLANGTSRTATLRVPFDGALSLPKTNYSGAGDDIHAFGPYQLGITRLKLRDKHLEVWIATEKSSTSVIFDVAGLLNMPGE